MLLLSFLLLNSLLFLVMTDFVQVDVVLTLLDETFSEELEDVSSQKYKTLETRVTREVTFLRSTSCYTILHRKKERKKERKKVRK